nr:hypothetical protein [Sedimentibacter sp.]
MSFGQIVIVIGYWTIWVTPLTLVLGIIYAIKKPENEATPYLIMAIVSAYLIILPLFFRS